LSTAALGDDKDQRGAGQHNHHDDTSRASLPPSVQSNCLPKDGLGLRGVDSRFARRVQCEHDGDTLLVTMADVKGQRDPSLHLHEWVAAEIRRDIANGDISPGHRLPPSKDMAAVLGVHPNTVLRALRLLRDEGVLEFRRGRGVTVVGQPERGLLAASAQALLSQARRFGLAREDLIELIQGLP
jgi:GntR family transcriptional regulator